MTEIITLAFVNRDAAENDELRVSRDSAPAIARWYGGYHGGDDYDVLIDGETVDKDVNGEIPPQTIPCDEPETGSDRPHDGNVEATASTALPERHVITAMCLWEALLNLTDANDADDEEDDAEDARREAKAKATELLKEHGSFEMRSALYALAPRCDAQWTEHVRREPNTTDQLDWDWCPSFVVAAIADGSLEERLAA